MNPWIERTDKVVFQTYGRFPIVLERGEGCRLWDNEGRSFLDLVAGLAVCNVGHCHPKVVEAIRRQCEKTDPRVEPVLYDADGRACRTSYGTHLRGPGVLLQQRGRSQRRGPEARPESRQGPGKARTVRSHHDGPLVPRQDHGDGDGDGSGKVSQGVRAPYGGFRLRAFRRLGRGQGSYQREDLRGDGGAHPG